MFVNISLTMDKEMQMYNLEGGYYCLDSTLTKLIIFVGWIVLEETMCSCNNCGQTFSSIMAIMIMINIMVIMV
jgi:hypothetical protein